MEKLHTAENVVAVHSGILTDEGVISAVTVELNTGLADEILPKLSLAAERLSLASESLRGAVVTHMTVEVASVHPAEEAATRGWAIEVP